jgi:hypothetical protein
MFPTAPGTPKYHPSYRPKPSGKKVLRGILGLAAGVLTDLGGTNLVGVVYLAWLVIQKASALAAQNVPQAEIQTALISEFYGSMVNSLPVIVIGLVFSVLGGFVAGRITRYGEAGFGAATGVGTALVSIAVTLIFRLPTAPAPIWRRLLSLAASLGASMLGGCLAFIIRKTTKVRQPSLEEEIEANRKADRRHSRFGMASLAFGIVSFLGTCGSFVSILYFAFQKNYAAFQPLSSMEVIVFLGMLLPALIGAALGVIGLFERDRKKTLATAGFLLNTSILLGIVLVIWLFVKMNIL